MQYFNGSSPPQDADASYINDQLIAAVSGVISEYEFDLNVKSQSIIEGNDFWFYIPPEYIFC